MVVYACRAYPLDHKIPKSHKLEPRAHIGYMVGYDSTNIYRIWIPSHEEVVRTRDVTFNEKLFYDPKELDLGYVLRERERIDKVLEVPDPPSSISESTTESIDVDESDDIEETQTPQTTAKEAYLPTPSPSHDSSS